MTCTLCPLHKEAITVCVAGGKATSSTAPTLSAEGPRFLVVGSQPTSQEDIAGALAVGGGLTLSSLMKEAGFKSGEWAYTTAVRCYGHSNPKTENINACRAYLIEEVRRARPSVIIALGDAALRSLTKGSGLGARRGKELRTHSDFDVEIPVYSTYSPTSLVYAPRTRETIISDLRRARTHKDQDEPLAWQRADMGSFYSASPVAIDIETDYYQGGDGSKITQLAYAADLDTVYVSYKVPASIVGNPVIGHNSWAFDIPKLQEFGCDVDWGDDTIVLAYLDDENQPKSLESLCVKYLGVKGWKEDKAAALGSDKFALYNARDAEYTRRLWKTLCGRLGGRKKIADLIIRPAFLALQACTQRGIFINQNEAAALSKKYSAELDAAEDECARLADKDNFNPRSNEQVAGFLFGDVKHCVDEQELRELGHPLGLAVLKARHARKMLSTYVDKFRATARIHPNYTLWRTVTGRTSAHNPSLQNTPREMKNVFGAPEGYTLLSCDYSAIEFRLAAWIAGATEIMERYAENREFDPHQWMADILGTSRQVAKSANFGLLYKQSPAGLQQYCRKNGIELSYSEAAEIHGRWHSVMPAFGAWYAKTDKLLRKQGYIESVTGRRRNFGDPALLRRGVAYNGMLREAINFQVQSLAADLGLVALANAHKAGLLINGFVHDSITLEVENGFDKEELENRISTLMVTDAITFLKEHFGVDITIPIDVKITYTQGEQHEHQFTYETYALRTATTELQQLYLWDLYNTAYPTYSNWYTGTAVAGAAEENNDALETERA